MNRHDLEPLAPDIARLLELEREAYPEDAALKADVLAGVERASVLGELGTAAALRTGVHAATWTTRALVALFMGGALLGSGVTYGVQMLLRERTPAAPLQVSAPAAPAASPELPRPVVEPLLPGEPSQPPPAKPPEKPRLRATGPSVLAAEQRELSAARAALTRGRVDDALEAVGNHERLFPRGQLAEERELIAIQALTLAGKDAEASRRAAHFRERFPQSVFLPALDAARAAKNDGGP